MTQLRPITKAELEVFVRLLTQASREQLLTALHLLQSSLQIDLPKEPQDKEAAE